MGVFSWLAARFSRSTVMAPIESVQTPALYFQHTRIGGSLTPEDVSSILRERDTGYMYRFVDLVSEARAKDCHLESVLETRELAAASMNWAVTPATEKRADKKIADWCTDWLKAFGTSIPSTDDDEPRDLRTLIAHLTGSGNLFGYAVAETIFEKDGAYVVPVGCNPLHPRRFVYRLGDGRLCHWDMFGNIPYPGTDLAAEYPGRFVVHRPRLNGDTSAREGYGATLMWAALFRNWSIADWLKLAEIAWKPWRIGYYEKGSQREDIAALQNAMQTLTTNGVAWLPKTVEFDVAWAKQRGSGSHGELAAFLAAEMSKCVLGATLAVEQGRVGSQALGKVHDEMKEDRRDADGWAAASSIRRMMIAPAVRLNFGRDAKIPGFALVPPRSVDIVQFSMAVKNFSDAGLVMDAVEIRELATLKNPEDGAETIGGAAPAPVPPPIGGPKKPAPVPQLPPASPPTEDPNVKPGEKPAKKALAA